MATVDWLIVGFSLGVAVLAVLGSLRKEASRSVKFSQKIRVPFRVVLAGVAFLQVLIVISALEMNPAPAYLVVGICAIPFLFLVGSFGDRRPARRRPVASNRQPRRRTKRPMRLTDSARQLLSNRAANACGGE